MRRRSRMGSAVRTAWPSTVMRPVSASISRFVSRSSVVLPEPEPPTMARNPPPATPGETSSTALTPPPSKLLPTCANAIRGGTAVIVQDYHTAPKRPSQPGAGRSPYRLNYRGDRANPPVATNSSGKRVQTSVAAGSTAVALDNATVAFRLANNRVYTAVEQARLAVEHGEFVAIVGPTGCGKSTLLNVAAGLLKPVSGSVRIFDAPLAGLNLEAGYLFQADALFPWKTAVDNVAIGLEITGTPRAQALERAQGWLAQVGLGAFGNRYPHMLSGGQRKRVGLAQVLIRDPKILLMDEPFGPLDAQTRQIMGNLLLELWNADRKAVLFVTHDLEEAIALADRVVIMSAGPGSRIIGDWRVPLRRPRDISEIRMEQDFHALHREIWSVLKAEVLKGYAQSSPVAAEGG